MKTKQICEKYGIQAPYSLEREGASSINILEVIRIFTEALTDEEKSFEKVWDPHFQSNSLEKSDEPLSGLYHFSESMSQMLESDLLGKLDDLDFDKDPFRIAGELVEALQKFDEISKRQTLNVIKPKLEQWLSSKLVSIRELVARGISFETWTPISEVSL